MKTDITLSKLGHTWVLKHNGYLTDGCDTVLSQAKNFICKLPSKDMIVILTSRKEEFRNSTETFLKNNGIRYDHIIFNVPYGERILINDEKPGGLQTAQSINIPRDQWTLLNVTEDENL